MCDISFLDSNFVTSLIGSLAGAAGGAFAAQHLGDKSKKTEELIKEIRSVNVAISLAAGICETYIHFKTQLLLPVLKNFNAEKARLSDLNKIRATEPHRRIPETHLVCDLRSFHPFTPPTDSLMSLAQEKITPKPRATIMISRLKEVVDQHNHTISERNKIIGRMQADQNSDDEDRKNFYFGLPLRNGNLNTEYPDTLNALVELTDTLIFFSSQINDDLFKHGVELIKQYKNLGGEIPVKSTKIDFDNARKSGLIPSNEGFKDWFEKFKD